MISNAPALVNTDSVTTSIGVELEYDSETLNTSVESAVLNIGAEGIYVEAIYKSLYISAL